MEKRDGLIKQLSDLSAAIEVADGAVRANDMRNKEVWAQALGVVRWACSVPATERTRTMRRYVRMIVTKEE